MTTTIPLGNRFEHCPYLDLLTPLESWVTRSSCNKTIHEDQSSFETHSAVTIIWTSPSTYGTSSKSWLTRNKARIKDPGVLLRLWYLDNVKHSRLIWWWRKSVSSHLQFDWKTQAANKSTNNLFSYSNLDVHLHNGASRLHVSSSALA